MLSDKYLWPVPELTLVHETYKLVSFQEPVTQGVRQGLQSLSAEQNQYTPHKAAITPHHTESKHHTLLNYCDGLDYQTTPILWIRLHSYHYGPRLLESSVIIPLQGNNRNRRPHETLF
jgi:hypothetical protein